MDKQQENERYSRVDTQGGYIYNKSDISYYKQTQTIDVMNNLMLGDFNQKGNYVIDKSLIDQLVKVKKVYQYSFGSTTFCQSMYDVGGYGKIDFAIKIRNNTQNGTTTAVLQLLETIDRANGYYQNTNTASIANYTANESSSFIVDMLKYFNVVSKKDEGLLRTDKKEEDVGLVVARRRYMELLKKGTNEKLDAINKDLYEKRIKLLGKSNVGKKILAELNSEMYKINGWFLKEGMPGYYRYLNQILDGLYERRSVEVLQDIAFVASWRGLNESFAQSMSKSIMNANLAIEKLSEKTKDDALRNQIEITKHSNVEQKVEPKVAPKAENVVSQNKTENKNVAKTEKEVKSVQDKGIDRLKREAARKELKKDNEQLKNQSDVLKEEEEIPSFGD